MSRLRARRSPTADRQLVAGRLRSPRSYQSLDLDRLLRIERQDEVDGIAYGRSSLQSHEHDVETAGSEGHGCACGNRYAGLHGHHLRCARVVNRMPVERNMPGGWGRRGKNDLARGATIFQPEIRRRRPAARRYPRIRVVDRQRLRRCGAGGQCQENCGSERAHGRQEKCAGRTRRRSGRRPSGPIG